MIRAIEKSVHVFPQVNLNASVATSADWSSSGRELHALDAVALFERQHDIDPVGHLTEHRMHAVEMGLRFQHQEELRSPGIPAGMSHGERAGLVLVGIAASLAGDAPARAAGTRRRSD